MDITFNLIVPSLDGKLFEAWKKALDEKLSPELRSHFRFIQTRLEELPPETKFDAIVSPANSYGRMDGAFDNAISKLLSPPGDYFALTRFAQTALYQQSRGFLPPGTATILRLPDTIIESQKGSTGCSHMIICPTMQWPQDISWDRYVVYNATWAILAALDKHNDHGASSADAAAPLSPIRSLLMPGLGTGTGNIPAQRFAAQFSLAITNFDEALRNPAKWSTLSWDQIEEMSASMKETVDVIDQDKSERRLC